MIYCLKLAFSIILLPCLKGSLISLPFVGGAVTFAVDDDDQRMSFRIDSGSARFFALYGPEYERQVGPGSCAKIRGCYFCTSVNPCDDILQRETWMVRFAGGVYTYVVHNVSITVGGVSVPNIQMGLAIYASDRFERLSTGLLGLSYGRMGIPETFLDQLRSRNLIPSDSYWVHTSRYSRYFAGTITFGAFPEGVETHTVPMERNPKYFLRKIVIPLSQQVQGITQRHNLNSITVSGSKQGAPAFAFPDTGSRYICMPKSDFTDFFNAAKGHLFLLPKSEIYRVKKKDIGYLPTLVYQIGELQTRMDIRIEPKHYVTNCDAENGDCSVLIGDIGCEKHILGQPLFYAYDVGFLLSGFNPSISLRVNDDAEPGKG